MSPVEIIFILLGIVILVASCFISGDKEGTGEAVVAVPEEILETQKQEIKKYVDQVLEVKSEETIVKTDDYLSKISNEKIMAVNDFSEQILEKIDANHKEVVFLYDMLNQKEDELKETVRQFEEEKGQLREAVDDVIKLTKQVNLSKKKPADVGKTESKAAVAKKPEIKKAKPAEVKAVENQNNGQMEFAEMLQGDRQKEEVLKLFKQGKSVLEISKMMGMGQGEVKLIIGLYGA